MPRTEVIDLGLIDYHQALAKQLELVEQVQEDPELQYIVICSHPPVATLGRKTKPEDVAEWKGEQVEVQRGGRVTYHGPNQIVVYPIVNLTVEREHLKARDLHGYLRLLEQVVIKTLAECGIPATNKPAPEFLALQQDVEPTGVWVGNHKICSIGIGVKKWVTYHGLALNIIKDDSAFQGLKPCGFSPEVMTSMEQVAGSAVDREFVKSHLLEFTKTLSNFCTGGVSR